MGHQALLAGVLGFLLILGASGRSSKQDEIPMRMADETLVVSNYNGDEAAASSQSSVTVSPDDGTEYQVYQGVMGRPGIDFPVHPSIPATSFSCRDIKRSGYYADLETDCQVFHICDGGRKISFICPNGTIFRQSHLICDWWFRVDCGKSVELYEESAEQLAADQKIYKERSDERERQRKLVKSAHQEPEVYALDEPYQKPAIQLNRQNNGERKSERNSKRVMDADFSNMYPGRQGKILETVSERTGKLSGVNERNPTSTANPIVFTPRSKTINFENFQQSASAGFANGFNHRTKHVFAVDKSLIHTTQRPFTDYTTASSTTRREEIERQQLAESASFASHRGSRTFTDFNNANQILNVPVSTQGSASTTTVRPTTSFQIPSKDLGKVAEFSSVNADKNYRQKSIDERLKYIPFSSSSPAYKPTIPIVKVTPTTPVSTTYSTARSRVPVDDVYFTTIVPESSAPPHFEANKINMSSNSHEVALSLQELNIHKTTIESSTTKKYTDDSRDGLEVPPSFGPSALRSFALYFAGPDDENRQAKHLSFLPDNVLIIPIRTNVGKKATNQQNVLQQVDELVKISNATLKSPEPSPDDLPSSLTPQTQNSYNALFNEGVNTNNTDYSLPETEEPLQINTTAQGNDLSSSQSRGIVEPEIKSNSIDDKLSRVAPDLRELAQVFTKALSAYLDDPEGFRKVLSEIRPTEPTLSPAEISASPIEYPSATQEEDEVLDFSDVTKPSKRRGSTEAYRETTTEQLETTTLPPNDVSNYVLPLSSGLNTSASSYPVPEIDLRAPFESLDQSQSSYYTPSPNQVGTTNAIAEEINKEFSPEDSLPDINSNEAVDSYVPVYGSVDDQSRPRYGGFQNNSGVSYAPYGSELTTASPVEDKITTFNPKNKSSVLYTRLVEESAAEISSGEIKSINDATKSLPIPFVRSRTGKKLADFNTPSASTVRPTYLTTTLNPQYYEPNPEEINLELSPPFETESPQGFFVTYTLVNGELQTNKPLTTVVPDEITTIPTEPTTISTERITTQLDQTETYAPSTISETYYKNIITTLPPTTTTPVPPTTVSRRRGKSGKSLERLLELQETLMFNKTNVSPVEKEQAREMIQETMGNMTMTDMTATTLTKMMELAAKNETYRRLVLLLVNDRSGRNKTVEEARLSLLRALLTPVISQGKERRQFSTSTTTTTTEIPFKSRSQFRRGKNVNLSSERTKSTMTPRRVTTASPEKIYRKTTIRPRVVKTTEAPTTTSTTTQSTTVTTTTEKASTVIGNLGLIRKTIEESKAKEIKVNSLDDAILDSDSRAIELLRSLYSLAARWG